MKERAKTIILIVFLLFIIGNLNITYIKPAEADKTNEINGYFSMEIPEESWDLLPPENPEPGEEMEILNTPEGGNCALIIREHVEEDLLPFPMGYPGIGSFKLNCEHAINVLSSKGYNIKYLIGPIKVQIKWAINHWIPKHIGGEKKVFIYINGHGGIHPIFKDYRIETRYWLRISTEWFAYQLNQIKNQYSICVSLIESCYSGHAVDELSQENRIVITSTDADSVAYFDGERFKPDGEAYFSKAFFDNLDMDTSIGVAWEKADENVISNVGDTNEQNPQIEDTWNGLSVGKTETIDRLPMTDAGGEQDGILALRTWLNESGNKDTYYYIPTTTEINADTTEKNTNEDTNQDSQNEDGSEGTDQNQDEEPLPPDEGEEQTTDPITIVSITPDGTITVEEGETIDFTVTVTGGSGNNHYTFYGGDGNSVSGYMGYTAIISYTYNEAGSFEPDIEVYDMDTSFYDSNIGFALVTVSENNNQDNPI